MTSSRTCLQQTARPTVPLEGRGTAGAACRRLALLWGLAFVLLFSPLSFTTQVAQAQPNNRDWSGDARPEGWSAEAYSPDSAAPNFDEDYEGPRGDDYDSREDPNHPLKDPTKDPGEEWEGSSGSGLNQNFVAHSNADWPWGERYYDAVFAAPLIIHNSCKTPQKVGIFVNGNPYLTMPALVVAQPGDTTVTGQVQLAPEPEGPHHSGEGWIDFGPIIIPPGMFPPPQLHQPNFEELEGEVVVWHAWSPEGDCNAVRRTYTIGGHMHFRPPPPEGGGGGPSSLATTDMCTFYWLMGFPPAQLGDKDCTQEIRELAAHYLDKIIASYVLNSPEDWLWLPSAGDIGQMSIDELLAMKAHAEAVIGVGPGADAAAAGQPPADAPATTRSTVGGSSGGVSIGIRSQADRDLTNTAGSEGGWSFDNGAGASGGAAIGGSDSPAIVRPGGASEGAPLASPIDGASGQQIQRLQRGGQ